MIEYKVGEVFTTDEGKTVQCVRSNGLCSGCVFLTKIGDAPRCEAMDVDCSDCSREDGQHVIFKEIERVTYNKEYKPGTVMRFRDKLIICNECKKEDHCGGGCVFWDEKNCLPIPCHWRDRSDGKAVEFLEVEDFDGSKKYKPGDIVNVSGMLMRAKITFVNYANEK